MANHQFGRREMALHLGMNFLSMVRSKASSRLTLRCLKEAEGQPLVICYVLICALKQLDHQHATYSTGACQ